MFYKQNNYSNYDNYETNGNGERIYFPDAYHQAVSEDRYGYNSYNQGWGDGYSCGYGDGYGDACDNYGW